MSGGRPRTCIGRGIRVLLDRTPLVNRDFRDEEDTIDGRLMRAIPDGYIRQKKSVTTPKKPFIMGLSREGVDIGPSVLSP